MRGLLGLPLALTLVLALAGPAMASDYMLPVLVPQQAAPAPAPGEPPGEPSVAEPAASSFTPVSAGPLTVLAALVGALAVTALTFVALGRSDRRPARRA